MSGRAKQLRLKTALALRKGHAFLSLYSPIDGIFCLTYSAGDDRAAEKKRSLHLRRSGTNVLLFDVSRRSLLNRRWSTNDAYVSLRLANYPPHEIGNGRSFESLEVVFPR